MTRPLPHWTLTLWTLCNVLNILSGVRTHCIGTDNGHLSLRKGQIFVLDPAQNKTSATFSRQLCQQLWDFVYIEEYDTALQQYIHSVRRGVVKSFLRSYFFFEVEIMWFIMSLCTSKAWSCTRSRSKMFYFDISVPIICTKSQRGKVGKCCHPNYFWVSTSVPQFQHWYVVWWKHNIQRRH